MHYFLNNSMNELHECWESRVCIPNIPKYIKFNEIGELWLNL